MSVFGGVLGGLVVLAVQPFASFASGDLHAVAARPAKSLDDGSAQVIFSVTNDGDVTEKECNGIYKKTTRNPTSQAQFTTEGTLEPQRPRALRPGSTMEFDNTFQDVRGSALAVYVRCRNEYSNAITYVFPP